MKILLLTQYFPPEFGAAAARNSEHARQWAAAGHEVEVCTGMPNYPDGVIREAYRGSWYRREERDVLINLGVVSMQQGDLNDADGYYAEALALTRELGDRSGMMDLCRRQARLWLIRVLNGLAGFLSGR